MCSICITQDRLAGGRSPVVVVMLVLGIAALFVYEGNNY